MVWSVRVYTQMKKRGPMSRFGKVSHGSNKTNAFN